MCIYAKAFFLFEWIRPKSRNNISPNEFTDILEHFACISPRALNFGVRIIVCTNWKVFKVTVGIRRYIPAQHAVLMVVLYCFQSFFFVSCVLRTHTKSTLSWSNFLRLFIVDFFSRIFILLALLLLVVVLVVVVDICCISCSCYSVLAICSRCVYLERWTCNEFHAM